MQAGIQSFDLPIQCSSTDGRKNVATGTKKEEEQVSDKLSGFMEIMSALMAMPQEQLKNSLLKLDADSAEGDLLSIDPELDPDQQDIQSSELMALILNLNGAIQKELQDTEGQDRTKMILDMAKEFVSDQKAFASDSDEDIFMAWKAKWFHLDDLAGNVHQGDGKEQTSINLSAQNQIVNDDLFPVMKNADGQQKQMQLPSESEFDPQTDLGDGVMPKATPSEAVAKNMAQQPFPARDVFSQAANNQPAGDKNLNRDGKEQILARAALSLSAGNQSTENKIANSDVEKQPFVVEISNPLVADKFDAENLQSRLVSDEGDPGPDTQSLDDLSLQKPSLASGGHNGLLSRSDMRADQELVHVTGEKELMPQDKALQSDVIRQIVQRMSMHTQGSQSKMVIHLKPEHLGDVHMQVLTENHQVTVRMMADSIGVKEIVEQNLQHLRAEMQHHGLEIQKFDVFVANDNEGWKSGQEQSGFRESLRQRKQRFDSGKAKINGTKSISSVGIRKAYNQKNLNEIDYFA